MIAIGKTYTDGWGKEHRVAGIVPAHPEWVWAIGGFWFRQSDGRKIVYPLMDPSKPDGPRRHVPGTGASNWDLKVEKEESHA